MKSPRLKTTLPHNTLLDLFSYSIALSLSLVLFATFAWAYLFNNFVFRVYINNIGEAHWELVMLCGLICFLFYGLIIRCEELKKYYEVQT